jgi:hypothetical protein
MVIWHQMQRHSPFFPEYPGFQHGARLFTAQTASAILAPQNDTGHICAEIGDRRQKQQNNNRPAPTSRHFRKRPDAAAQSARWMARRRHDAMGENNRSAVPCPRLLRLLPGQVLY